MDSIAANYSSEDSDSDSDGIERSLEPPLARIPSEVIEKYKLGPNTSKYEAMSLRSLRAGPQRWRTFLYYEWRPNRLERAQIMRVVTKFNDVCQNGNVNLVKDLHFGPLCLSSLGAPLSLHISLSQSIILETEAQRDLLYENLQRRIRNASDVSPFTMKFDPTLRLLPSYGKDTLFLTLPVEPSIKSKEMASINRIIQEAASETFPDRSQQDIEGLSCMPATTHMSIAMTANVSKTVLDKLSFVPLLIPMKQEDAVFEFPITALKFDKNRQILSIPLD